MADTNGRALSPTRTRAAWKPGVFDEPVPFYGRAAGGPMLVGVDGGTGPRLVGGGRRPVAELPYAPAPDHLACPEGGFERLEATGSEACEDRFDLSYDVVGGFDANALRVFWECAEGSAPRWIALKTFTGLQLKYVLPGKRPPLVFALADEDAYAYCDEDPCIACTFHCKRGFEIYACLEDGALVTKRAHDERLTS